MPKARAKGELLFENRIDHPRKGHFMITKNNENTLNQVMALLAEKMQGNDYAVIPDEDGWTYHVKSNIYGYDATFSYSTGFLHVRTLERHSRVPFYEIRTILWLDEQLKELR